MNHITTTEAAERLGISSSRVRVLIAAGRLPAIAVNTRMMLIDPRDLVKVKTRKTGRPSKKR